jgi:hypothetical protein
MMQSNSHQTKNFKIKLEKPAIVIVSNKTSYKLIIMIGISKLSSGRKTKDNSVQ